MPTPEPLRVLEIGNGIASAYAARLLADQGADVVKVEPPEGDPARRLGPFANAVDEERSGLFLAVNLNKRGICLDLGTDGDQDGGIPPPPSDTSMMFEDDLLDEFILAIDDIDIA